MEDKFHVVEDCLVVDLPEEIDHHLADSIKKWADLNIVRKNIRNVVFDFKDTKFMDSSGIGVVLGRYKMIKTFGGRVMCVNADKRIKMMLKMSGIDKIADIVN